LRVAVADAKSGEPVWYEASVVGTQRSSDLAVLRVQLADGEGKDGGLVPVKVS
jgi:S1-C subfamily serine protease